MNLEKVLFGGFIIFALTLNFGFFIGDIDNIAHHNGYELFVAIVVSLIATALKFGDRTQLGALMLATSLVADVQLLAAAVVWGYAEHIAAMGMSEANVASIVSLAGGALLANFTSVVLLVIETLDLRH